MKRSAAATIFVTLMLGSYGWAQTAGNAPSPKTATPEILISAASSLTDVVTALKPEAERRSGAKILLNFGASGSLRAQIESGAPVDLFFSASGIDMDRLQKGGFIEPGSRKDVLTNSMVLIGDRGSGAKADTTAGSIKDLTVLRSLLAGATLLAIGNPDTVPAGQYSMQALDSLGLSSLVEGKLVYGGNVRQVLQYVSSGAAPLGIVFKTDALTLPPSGDTVILFEFPLSASEIPRYPIAVMASSKHKDAAARAAAYLAGPEAAQAFARAGFGTTP